MATLTAELMQGILELPATLRAKLGLTGLDNILLPQSVELDVELGRSNHLLLDLYIAIVCIKVAHLPHA